MAIPVETNGTLAAFSKWIAESPLITDELAIARATNCFQDTIACIISGVDAPATEAVYRSYHKAGVGFGSVVGRSTTLSTENAAMVNGTAAHALDFDDNYLPAVTHASAVLVPTLLALGEEVGALGDVLLDAFIVGLEMQAWLGRQMIPSHYASGWHSTSTIGAIGAAAACARLLSLDEHKVQNAIGISCSMASGSKRQFGSMVKPLHAGLAARAGISAVRLALGGVEANNNPIDGDWGFVKLYNGNAASQKTESNTLSIISDGVAQKRFPCCASAHRTLDAIIALRKKHEFVPEDVRNITTVIPSSNYKNLRFDDPKTENEARFSMTYTAALAIIFGTIRLGDFTIPAIERSDVQHLMTKIIVKDAGPDSDLGEGIWDFPATTEIVLRDGRVLNMSVSQPTGTISVPMSKHDNRSKLSDCIGVRLSLVDREKLESQFSKFGGVNSRDMAALLRQVKLHPV